MLIFYRKVWEEIMKRLKKSLNIIGYVRESTKDQVINGFNLEDQEKKIQAYYELYYSSVDTLTFKRERGSSAKNLVRPVFKEVMAEIKSNKIDILIIHNLDRLTRKVRDLSVLLELFGKHDVELVSITERIDTTTPMGRFFIYLIVLIAQWEQDTIGDRAKRGVYESAAQGNYSKGGPPPLGYERVREGKRVQLLTVDEIVPVIQDIFDKLATNTFSIKSLARYLNQNNTLGIKWYQSRIFNIINNPIYYGHFQLGPVEKDDFVPMIITKNKFDEVQNAINGRKLNTRNKYIFKDKIKCDKCGTVCTQEASNKKKKIYKYYYCPKCNKRINETVILKIVDYELSSLFLSLTKNEKRERLKSMLKKNQLMLSEITAAFESDLESTINFREKIYFYQEEIKKTEKLISELEKKKYDISFSDLSFTIQRKLLCDACEYIKMDIVKNKLRYIKYFEKNK